MLHSDNLALSISDANKITNTQFSSLSYVDAARLSEAAKQDSKALAQVAWVCLSEGVSDANRKRYTWATVKLYYAAFQALRARLLWSGHIVFYRGRTPYSISSVAGDSFKKRSGNTHSAVFKLFRDLFPNNAVLAQPINGCDALEWMEEFRNAASYSAAPIQDPSVPREFKLFSQKPRAFIQKCLDTSSGAAFDPDSALIALPFFLIVTLDDILHGGHPTDSILIEKFFIDILASESLFLGDFSKRLSAYSFVS